jgi:protein SCO1/2
MKRTPFAVIFSLTLLLVVGPAPASAASSANYKRTMERYSVPDVTLVNQDGKRVRLLDLVDGGKPVVLDFIYGTCTTICPVLSANFTNFQRKLGEGVGKVQLVSISIDPENDTPMVMKKYLKNYLARPGWDFLTGSREDIDRVMRAFSAYVPNKMSHYPIMFLRAPRGDQWVRIYGLIGTKDFLAEYEKVARP